MIFLGKVVFVFVFFTFQNAVAEADKPAVLIFPDFEILRFRKFRIFLAANLFVVFIIFCFQNKKADLSIFFFKSKDRLYGYLAVMHSHFVVKIIIFLSLLHFIWVSYTIALFGLKLLNQMLTIKDDQQFWRSMR